MWYIFAQILKLEHPLFIIFSHSFNHNTQTLSLVLSASLILFVSLMLIALVFAFHCSRCRSPSPSYHSRASSLSLEAPWWMLSPSHPSMVYEGDNKGSKNRRFHFQWICDGFFFARLVCLVHLLYMVLFIQFRV